MSTAIMSPIPDHHHRSSPFDTDRLPPGRTKDLPVHSSSANHSGHPSAEPMDLSPRTADKEPRDTGSPTADRRGGSSDNNSDKEAVSLNSNPQPVGAAAAAQQPKLVQTAFIHKLYSMLEDQTIQHLISWSNTNESFVMSPSTEFSKVLASYFKHTNISSFVRQLNMYGFHKVSDVFHTGAPDSPLWEFKHGGGSFKRGDLVGLREIKRRASRHTLMHRDSFSGPPKVPSQHPHLPPQPVEAVLATSALAPPPPKPTVHDPVESRFGMMEFNFGDLYARLARTEEAFASLSSKCQMLSEGLARCHHYSTELSTQLLSIVPDSENPVHRDVSALRAEIARQTDQLRAQEPVRHSYVAVNNPYDTMAPPLSPRHQQHDASRRPSLQVPPASTGFKAPLPPHLASPRRLGSLSGPDSSNSASAVRPPQAYNTLPPPQPPHQQQQQYPPASAEIPPSNLSRRHTSADIRLQGWQGQPPQAVLPSTNSPYASGQASSHWPSSPYRPAADQDGQQLRNALTQYDISKASHHYRQTTPPPESGAAPSYANVGNEAGWQLPGPKFPFRNIDFSAPPTRRSSMASNVHSLLNPADTAERAGEDEPPEERKRKRMG